MQFTERSHYGNTIVFGQTLMEHIQPSGLALLALGDEPTQSRIDATANLLNRAWPTAVGTASVCFAALGLVAVSRIPFDLLDRLQVLEKRQALMGISPYRQALIATVALGNDCPLMVGRREILEAPDESAA